MTGVPFHPVSLAETAPTAPDLFVLRIGLSDPALAASFTTPGQYVQLKLPSGAIGYFAIASAPGAQGCFEFLVKRGGPAADELLGLSAGAALEMSPALGAGYPIADWAGQDVLLFAVGSGISAIRSLIWYLAGNRKAYAGVTLFFGARTPAHFAYRDEVAAWEQAGIQVVRVASDPQAAEPGYARGYVQDALKAHPITPEQTAAFVCGMPAMVEGVKAALVERGVSVERVFQNY